MTDHSTDLADRLLSEHFDACRDGAVVRYRPRTPDAHLHWVHTGVCPRCLARSIACARCVACGWEPDDERR